MIQQMLAVWSLVPLPFLNPAWISGSSQFMYCWSLAWRILSITLPVCAAAAKSLQSCPTLCDPIDSSHQAPPSLGFSRQEHWSGLPFPSPMQESKKWKWSRLVMSDLVTPWTAAYQAPLSLGFSRQEYWSGLPLPLPVCRWVQLCGSLNILWHCLSLGLEWKLTFSSPVATAEWSKFAGILSAALSQYYVLGFEVAQLEFYHLH